MERINKIFSDKNFRARLKKLGKNEDERVFCKHGLTHLLDVARIADIINIKEEKGFDKEIIYTAALFHDLGRTDMRPGEKHAAASSRLARDFLPKFGYLEDEVELIASAIRTHSGKNLTDTSLSDFQLLIRRADKLSRLCCICPEKDGCGWPDELKNRGFTV